MRTRPPTRVDLAVELLSAARCMQYRYEADNRQHVIPIADPCGPVWARWAAMAFDALGTGADHYASARELRPWAGAL
jgi:hypothetical protein